MVDLLVHVSNRLFYTSNGAVAVIDPAYAHCGERCICFSEGCFVSWFGQYLYLFDKRMLIEEYDAVKCESYGLGLSARCISKEYGGAEVSQTFMSQNLQYEYRVYRPVPVEKALGVLKHWDHTKGTLERWFEGKLLSFVKAEEGVKKER